MSANDVGDIGQWYEEKARERAVVVRAFATLRARLEPRLFDEGWMNYGTLLQEMKEVEDEVGNCGD